MLTMALATTIRQAESKGTYEPGKCIEAVFNKLNQYYIDPVFEPEPLDVTGLPLWSAERNANADELQLN